MKLTLYGLYGIASYFVLSCSFRAQLKISYIAFGKGCERFRSQRHIFHIQRTRGKPKSWNHVESLNCVADGSLPTDTYNDRFGGLKILYGDGALAVLRSAHVCIIGVGGVGSWTAEALARSGIGKITLVDMDEICISNTNRYKLLKAL